MRKSVRKLTILAGTIFVFSALALGQGTTSQELRIRQGGTIDITNRTGRVEVIAKPDVTTVSFSATSTQSISASELKIEGPGENLRIVIAASDLNKRIDVSLVVPERLRLKLETAAGEIRVNGDIESVDAFTNTGTISADVPTVDLRYSFLWTAARPRYLSDIELAKVKEKSRGMFVLKGRTGEKEDKKKDDKKDDEKNKSELTDTDDGADSTATGPPDASDSPNGTSDDEKSDKEKKKGEDKKDEEKSRSTAVELNFTTARGIVLLNVPPNEVTSDLRERPLTDAAKAIVRSGDLVLTDAIRRASPKYFGEYSRTLPPVRRNPELAIRATQRDMPGETTKSAVVRVTDLYNRSIGGLQATDFTVAESGAVRDIIAVQPHTAPVNLVLLLDVSGSVDNYVNFIRKAARAFIETARDGDRISLILFSEDVKVLSGFSTNKAKLSESLDTFDAGGATGYYDAVAYTLADTLRPLRGERTAVVVLTDGDDNRSFLPFESLIGAIEESGALIYPLYVPSALIAASESNNPDKAIDPLRTRYMTLSARATGEGERLAKVSGGVYYPITQLSQIQAAYDDIVTQIRTAYTVTFRSGYLADPNNLPSPRLKVRVNKPNTFVQVTAVIPK
ncbi:MAG TPA: VWA domain-containing protein [Pyrinomonadaceae bacterium]|nr:VWA domain-containing protein [Pyrinomonadaceae bacterium]